MDKRKFTLQQSLKPTSSKNKEIIKIKRKINRRSKKISTIKWFNLQINLNISAIFFSYILELTRAEYCVLGKNFYQHKNR